MRGRTERSATPTDKPNEPASAGLFEPRQNSKPTQFLFPDELKDRLRERAHVERRSMSELAREAVEQYLSR